MPRPDYSQVKTASQVPSLDYVVRELLDDYDLDKDEGDDDARGTGRVCV